MRKNLMGASLLSFIFAFSLVSSFLQSEIQSEYDLVVVGSGLAGVTSTIQSALLNPSWRILLLEKEATLGGNSMKATSGINMLNTPQQKSQSVDDSFESFYDDTLKSGKGIAVPELVETLVKGSAEINDFLKQFNIDLSVVSILGGHSKKRTHRPAATPVGFTIVSKLRDYILNSMKEQVTVRVNTTLTDVEVDEEERVRGVKISESNGQVSSIRTRAVILATGGFAHDFGAGSLLREFAPHLESFPTTNGPQAQGLGMKIARKLGCALLHMDQVQIHPTGFVDLGNRKAKQKILGPELLRGVGGILVNKKGNRFCNELGTRDYVTDMILQHGDSFEGVQTESFILLSQEAVDMYGKNINFYIGKGFLRKFDNLNTLADSLGIDAAQLLRTVLEYNQVASGGKPDEFGKTEFPTLFQVDNTIYAGIITPSLHYTMGGVSIDKNARVLKSDGSLFRGLFGAGEVTGGVHGGNRLGANSLMECVVYGRIAAKSASEYLSSKQDLKAEL